ncbi:thioesterase II family protein [Streptomyces sp. B93]|uniref:thioesterase II family protein n=1 Tax=Streptomyces sp. B93 TaxID=2824875 RepID=UPI001B36460C|nr:thioesterase [Streptomyces sp. B93]MBQ1089453.1 thioesterase [Streptomyces sp. B93]
MTPFERWILRPRPVPDAPLRLICVPYAGGGPAAYHSWAAELRDGAELWLLRPPGREARLQEPLLHSVDEIVQESAAAIAGHLAEPFAVFGYSVGAWIAFELVRELRDTYGLRAAHLGVAARPAPQTPLHHPAMHTLPDDLFLDVLDRRFRAIPPVIRDSPEMKALYLPILRADTTVLETYRYRPGPPLDCPVSAFGGTEDHDCRREDLMAWGERTTGEFRLRMLPGGHFFLHTRRQELLDALATDLFRCLVP